MTSVMHSSPSQMATNCIIADRSAELWMRLVKSDLVDVTSQRVDPVCQTSPSVSRSMADLNCDGLLMSLDESVYCRLMYTNQIAREETRCCHMSYSFQYAPFHRHYSKYHGLCHTSRGALAGTRNTRL